MLTSWSFYILRDIDHRSVSIVVVCLIVYYFFEHMQLVLSSRSSRSLLFLNELVLRLLANNDGLIQFLLLSVIYFLGLHNKVVLHHWPSHISVCDFERFLARFCLVVLCAELVIMLIVFERACIYLLNDYWIFHSLELWGKIILTFIHFDCILAFFEKILLIKVWSSGCGFLF